MIKLRLSGTREECAAALPALRAAFIVLEVSAFYPNRGQTVFGRVYVTVRLTNPTTGEIYASLGGA